MYRILFYALRDDAKHEMYAPERMLADIICNPEYHLIKTEFLYSYEKPDPNIPTIETIGQLETVYLTKRNVEHKGKLSAHPRGSR